MPDYTPVYTLGRTPWTAQASAPVTGGQLVEITGPGTVGPATAGGAPVGVAAHAAAATIDVTVHPLAGAIHELVAGSGGVTAGQPVTVGTAPDQVVAVSDGAADPVIGMAWTSAAEDGDVQVLGIAASGGGGGPVGLFDTAVLDFPEIAAGDAEELTITVTGAAPGDAVVLAAPAGVAAGLVWAGRVSAANTVTVRAANPTAAPIDPASATWGAHVIKH